ncbi:glucuronide transporter [Arthrobacter psychrolactophilus]|uniref:Glucuronide transporter n=1 Tax=Arthrobacter psychrolactophilus TaxID=92442 RepID=A0A2V5IZ57_9MICC|nr:glucuronide transporter [Arthrobacter psychrolactophilus]PYI39743.1 glucuronide transporter [Arthrobacter psychrolactophilus]
MTSQKQADGSTQVASKGSGPLPKISILGYGAGDAANNLAFTTATMFLLLYYTDVVGISAAAAGTLLLVVRIFDAFADVFAGRMVDKTYHKKLGKFRPFIMFGSIPLLLLSVATFSIPQIGQTGMLIWAYASYTLLGLAYSFVNIPFGSLAGAMTQVSAERAKLASARTIGAVAVGSFLGIFIAPLMKNGENLQPLFTTLTIVFAVVGTGLYMFTVFTAKERVVREVPKVSLKQSVSTLKGNKPLLLLCISSFLFLTGQLAISSIQIYYFRDVLDSLPLYAVMSIVNIFLTFGLAAALPRVVALVGKKRLYLVAGLLMAAGGLIVFFAPATMVWLAFTGVLISQMGIMLVSMLVWAMEADTVEYGEWRTGVRSEGITYALFSFTRKTGQAVGGALAAYALAWGGYASGGGEQSAQAILGIRAGSGLLPMVFALLAIAVMIAYPLTDAKHKEIVAEINARRANRLENALEARDADEKA